MRWRKLLWLTPVLACGGLAVAVTVVNSTAATQTKPPANGDPKAATTLPITQVVLFNSGVG